MKEIAGVVERNRQALYDLKLEVIIRLLTRLGRSIIQDAALCAIDGVSYISLWLRKDNLDKICRLNYLDATYFEAFKKTESRFELCAQPRGIVCHWIANNVPTLAFFSVVLSVLSRNGSLVKVPEQHLHILVGILKHLSEIEVESGGKTYAGKDIVDAIAIVSFDGQNPEESRIFSWLADCKIIWGGSEAVQAVTALPQKDHCEIIAFGPKYSFGVFDRAFIESEAFADALKKTVQDVAVFNQTACSSPQVLFFEKSKFSIHEIADRVKRCFETLPGRFLKQPVSQTIAAQIINARGMYLLDETKDILKSDDLSWTILIDQNVSLEEPVQGKTIFLKEVDQVDRVLGLITRKIQAMTVCISDPVARREFAKQATYRGVDRVVVPQKIHDFDLPWDGMLILNRLVRWVMLKS